METDSTKATLLHVDAFTETPFKGNPAGVCLLQSAADEQWMQNVANEMNLSETAFLFPEGDGYRLRWFTPQSEVDLCGHATLASAHVLYEKGLKKDTDVIQFYTKSGTLTTKKVRGILPAPLPSTSPSSPSSLVNRCVGLSLDEDYDESEPPPTSVNKEEEEKLKKLIEEELKKEKDLLEMDFPLEKAIEIIISDKEEREDKIVESCLENEIKVLLEGLQWGKDELVKVRYMGKNRMDLLIEVEDESLVLNLKPRFDTLAKANARCVIVTSKAAEGTRPGVDFISRVFAPRFGVNEDPVTGSAHCFLASHWAERLKKTTFVAYQASARGGMLGVSVLENDRVGLRGSAITFYSTSIPLPK